ncbi:hypothetical protein, partial [Pseudomonas sp. 2995-3]|uniref:hypothetical protein n=1 Tax=Pseudomonas sp. 2995-3 TaxID=1712680 RepID=UPI001C47FEB3
FYKNNVKLTIGAEGSFGMSTEDGYDYDGTYLEDGITYQTFSSTKNKVFQFVVCWMNPCTDDNDAQTWFGAITR